MTISPYAELALQELANNLETTAVELRALARRGGDVDTLGTVSSALHRLLARFDELVPSQSHRPRNEGLPLRDRPTA